MANTAAAVQVPVAKGLHHASASKTDLLLTCQWWAAPGTQIPPEPDDIRLAPDIPRFGRAFHKTMELFLGDDPGPMRTEALLPEIAEAYDVDQKRLTEYFKRGSKAVADFLKARGWDKIPRTIEKKLAYDPFYDTTRVLKTEGERDYSGRRPTEMPGTADLGLQPGPNRSRPLIVFDWKSGQSTYDASKNPQLRTLSLGLSRFWKTNVGAQPTATAAIAIILRIDDEFMELSEAPLTFDLLDKHRVLLRSKLRNAIEGKPALYPGVHCRYCPALEVCPAHQDPLALAEPVETMTEPEHVAQVYARLLSAENLLKKIRRRITNYVESNGPIELDNGKWASIVEYEEELLSKASINRTLGKLEGAIRLSQLRDEGILEVHKVKQLREINNPATRR